jgi:hypothetical protein
MSSNVTASVTGGRNVSHNLFPHYFSRLTLALLTVPALSFADHPIGVFGPTTGGPVVTPTAEMLPQGQWGLGVYGEQRNFEHRSRRQLEAQAAEEGHVHALDYLWSGSIALSYGIREDLTLALNLPYVRRDNIVEAHVHGDHGTGVHELGSASGLGDMALAAYWRVWQDESGLAAAVSLGSLLPTGEDDEISAEGERFETEFQPGSGAWRPFAGATLSWNAENYAWHSNLRYTVANEGAQDTELGDKIDYSLAFVYRLNTGGVEPHEHGPAVSSQHHHESSLRWDALLELTGEYTEGQTIAGATEADFENIVYLAPGVRLSGMDGWTAALSIGVPVYEHRKEGHTEADWRAVFTASLAL